MKKEKSGEPVDSRYAGVKVADEQLLIVSALIAGRLKKCGYDGKCEYFYSNNGVLSCKSDSLNWNASDEAMSAPRLEEVKKWLNTKGILINVYCRTERVMRSDGARYDYVATGEWMRSIYCKNGAKYTQVKRPINYFVSEEDALAISVREGIGMLLKENKKKE